MEKFLDTYDLPKLSQKYINNLCRLLTSNEIKAIIKSLNKTKPKARCILCQILPKPPQEMPKPIILKTVHKRGVRETQPYSD